jgi:hypothetical protein
MPESVEDGLLPTPLPGSRRDPRFDLRALHNGTYALGLWGRFSPGWCGQLSHGLAREHVDIHWGSARKRDGGWEAEFRLKPADAGVDLAAIDYPRLLRSRATSYHEVPIELLEHQIHTLPGALALKVRGADCVGFLASLLHRLAFLSLFPEEMRIETFEGEAVDRFRLKSLAGRAPSHDSLRALVRMLVDLTPRPLAAETL